MQKEGDVTSTLLRAGTKRKRSTSNENTENDINLKDKRLRQDEEALAAERKPLSELITRVSLSSPGSTSSEGHDPSTTVQEEFGLLTPVELDEDSCDSLSSHSSSWVTKLPPRPSPFPTLDWANEEELWDLLCAKDQDSLSLRDPHMLDRHPSIVPRMRTVLLDWLSEVCEVYTLHRETFYLTIDYIDRYLSTNANIVPKQQLQLIGVAALMIAAKVEEIYPPKVSDYAYVTDGACSSQDILSTEMNILAVLEWNITPVTAHYWLNVFLQVVYHRSSRCHNLGFIYPAFSRTLYTQCIRLLDLCHLDIRCLNYSYSVLATTAIYLVCSKELACMISGLRLESLEDCIEWMNIYWVILCEKSPGTDYCDSDSNELPPGPLRHNNVFDYAYSYHKHSVSMELSDLAIAESAKLLKEEQQPTTPGNRTYSVPCDMTPPPSSSKGQTTPSSKARQARTPTSSKAPPTTPSSSKTILPATPSSSKASRKSAPPAITTPCSSKSLRSGSKVTPSTGRSKVTPSSSKPSRRSISSTTPSSRGGSKRKSLGSNAAGSSGVFIFRAN
ncbi:hypothetical protein M8J77_016461 [Diaphorina citri]|nr:hypothetical protein M8J77_016461 [Diaphorina citri]